MSLATPSSVQKLQKALHDKAKESPSYRFYALYDKVYRKDVLACAYDRCHANRGAAGVDGQEFEDIKKYGVERWLDELAEELKSRTYQAQPVRRVMIDKPEGGKRPLGIPAIKDRVAELAAVLVLEPIFEADRLLSSGLIGAPATRAVRLSPGPQRVGRYMRRFVLGWKQLKHEKRLRAFVVNYADDLVICCRRQADEALTTMRDMMLKLKLTVNEKKTRVCRLPEEKFDFLGYTFGRCYSPKTGRAYIGTVPAKKRVQRICAAISELTGRSQTLRDPKTLVADLNRRLIGWANYFYLGPVSKAYRAVETHARRRLRQWLCAKHQVSGQGTGQYPDVTLHEGLGLVRLTRRTASFPWAKP
jgi:Group II intron, maturase-specific domain/Reverse transcriptase (RNA-dependent DNA polymerase)